MTEDKFLLISLEEEKAKKLTQVISSETARKVLNLLAEKDYSETEISQKLNIPLNTIDYNIEQLEKVGLIESKEFKWSEKGRKINYYKLVNKFIIISQKQKDFSSILKNILPVTLIGILISGVVYYTQGISIYGNVLTKSLSEVAQESVQKTSGLVTTPIQEPNYALYLLIGILITSFLYIIVNIFPKYFFKSKN